MTLDPNFAKNALIYWSYAEPRDFGRELGCAWGHWPWCKGGNGSSVARGRLFDGAPPRVEAVQVIFRQTPGFPSYTHFGGRLVFAPDGTLFVTLGERTDLAARIQAQQLDSGLGKIMRINSDGSIPADNPFVGRPGVQASIWSYGHRNAQGAAINPTTGELFATEQGARGGDEINIVRKGRNCGWPSISYGREDSGLPINGWATARPGMEQPIYFWDPSIAASGMAFYTGDALPEWKGNLFVAGLRGMLVRLVLDRKKVTGEERLLVGPKRIRDVHQGPDGYLYVVTDMDPGEVLRILPDH